MTKDGADTIILIDTESQSAPESEVKFHGYFVHSSFTRVPHYVDKIKKKTRGLYFTIK